jgi:methionyl-tRNA formyltransferase
MSNSLRIVFMGTPEFAVASLRSLHNSHHNVVAVVTAPDKPAGRGKQISQSAVKEYALQHQLALLQPINLKTPEFIEALRELKADLFVVVAFRMLPAVVWQMPPKGTINLHASLLPQYRGAAPINWAIINGEKESGLTTFFINEHIDTGDLIDRIKVPISEEMDSGNLHDLLMEKGAELLLKTVDSIAGQSANSIAQVSENKLIELKDAPKITRENSKINWTNTTRQILNFIRGMSPYPGAYTTSVGSNTQLVKIFKARSSSVCLQPGEIATDDKTFIEVGTGDGAISIEEIQVQGKRRMFVRDLLNGFKVSELKKFE